LDAFFPVLALLALLPLYPAKYSDGRYCIIAAA
jgi:hypothetical protein